VLMLHCPKCDAIFEAHENAHVDTTCPRCGSVVSTAAKSWSVPQDAGRGGAAAPDDGEHFLFTDDSRGHGISLTGRPGILRWTKNVAVRLVTSVCPGCGHTVRKGQSACPHCGRSLAKSPAPVSGELGRVLRKMLLAAAVFIGVPAAVIVFVLVVCAPKGSDVGPRAPRSMPAGPVQPRAIVPDAKPQHPDVDQPADRRGPRWGLRSLRKWLRGAEHGGSPPPNGPVGEAGGGAEKSAPPAGARNSDPVKPDATP
jgi:phage FluMu protein Com